MSPLTRAEARAIDAWALQILGLPTLVLMENAGRGAAEWLVELGGVGSRVVVVCGPGNNGGDGAVVARHLHNVGMSVRVAWLAPPDRLSPDAAVQHRALTGLGVDQRIWGDPVDRAEVEVLLQGADWVVDALFGTGLTRPVEGSYRGVIRAMNESGKPILALDIPSGLDADTGLPLGQAVRAKATATFVAPKLGFSAEGAAGYTGEVRVIGIGVPDRRVLP